MTAPIDETIAEVRHFVADYNETITRGGDTQLDRLVDCAGRLLSHIAAQSAEIERLTVKWSEAEDETTLQMAAVRDLEGELATLRAALEQPPPDWAVRLHEFLAHEYEALPTTGEAVTKDVRPHFEALSTFIAASGAARGPLVVSKEHAKIALRRYWNDTNDFCGDDQSVADMKAAIETVLPHLTPGASPPAVAEGEIEAAIREHVVGHSGYDSAMRFLNWIEGADEAARAILALLAERAGGAHG